MTGDKQPKLISRATKIWFLVLVLSVAILAVMIALMPIPDEVDAAFDSIKEFDDFGSPDMTAFDTLGLVVMFVALTSLVGTVVSLVQDLARFRRARRDVGQG